MIKQESANLIERFGKTNPDFSFEQMDNDPTVCILLDKMVVESLDRLIKSKVQRPLAAMAVWLIYSEDDAGKGGSMAAKLVSYRVCSTAALLEQYRRLRDIVNSGVDMNVPVERPVSLFEAENGFKDGITLLEKYRLVRRHLQIRGILKQKQRGREGARK